MADKNPKVPHAQRYLVTGILTVIPLWMTWLVFNFVFSQLSKFGMPWVRALSGQIREDSPYLARWLLDPLLQDFVAALITLIGLYVLGWMVNLVIGKRIIGAFESALNRLPLVQTVYGSTKKLISALQQKPDKIQRVVLIAFPSPEMKVVGFVTRSLVDKRDGTELAAVYVPTTPNPTSGYLEIIPMDQLIPTDWTIDEAMSFIISGGALAPEQVPFSKTKTCAFSESGADKEILPESSDKNP
jgi:uncharacterized membrane protein